MSVRYEVMVLLRRPVPVWLRAVGVVSGRWAARLYYKHYPPHQERWAIAKPRAEAMLSVREVAEVVPGAYVLVEVDESDPPPRIILRVVTDPSFDGFTAEVVPT